MAKQSDDFKERFRPDTSALDRELESALGGMSLDDLYVAKEKEQALTAPAGGAGDNRQKGSRRGRIISVTPDDVMVDFGGKSQGIAPLETFEVEPKVGDEMEFDVEKYDAREGLLILKRKGAANANVSWENLEVGQVVEGMVTALNKGGLELEVKSMRAFMPAGQVDLYFNPDLSVFIGQKLKAEVTQFDPRAKNLILSRRNILEREKAEAKEKLMAELAEGQVRRGTVRSVMDYGAFVDLGGVDGLLHISEISFRRGHKASEFVKVGDSIDVKILKIDPDTAKLSLSLKQARGVDPWLDAATKYGIGTQITGRVTKVESFGAFIEVEEGVEGLLPVSEISWQRIKHPADVVKEGDTVRLVVLSVDQVARRMSFSLKQAGPDPWKTAAEKYATDMIVGGTVTRTVDFGAFVELEPGLEGLVHISELSDKQVRQTTDVVKPGQPVQVRVLELDPQARRVSLSIRSAYGATTAATGAAPTTPATPKKPRKTPLKGGLDR
ncbi:MAG TPA: S1 RNA-binding domain-containing protein [Tepidisphaeraceae bacterium]|nr:S1 RNA-binding domain-containing protein [Tepidisphaeraceae bacterium]